VDNNLNMVNDAAAIRFSQELDKLPPEVGEVVTLVIPEFMNGCSWGFIKDNDEVFKKHIPAIQKNPKMSVFKVSGGYLVFMNMLYLVDLLKRISSGYITNKEYVIAEKNREKALFELNKELSKGERGLVGIYNLNDTNRITVKGKVYPAFCVSVNEFLTACIRNNRKIKVQGKVYTPDDISKNVTNFIKTLIIAPSGNALFVDVV
jgi:hypothetical protein